ncbi:MULTISPECIES: AbiTii domain-containing protein [unclassified Agarivorans]|uniref:AbiTii domain-containing protein n=1 Tax=unclassified Agarivorans TaxID=2636026 RepID=UPI003D7EFC1E
MSAVSCSPKLITLLEAVLQTALQQARTLNIDDLAQWSEHELNGYGDFAHFPDYRIVECKQFGIFEKAQQSLQHFEQIHDDCLNERDRCRLRYLHIQPALSQCLNNQEETQRAWPTLILANYAEGIIPGYRCVRAWQSYHKPLQERLINGVLGHLLHLIQLSDCPEQKPLLNEIKQLCEQENNLRDTWQKLYTDCHAPSTIQGD